VYVNCHENQGTSNSPLCTQPRDPHPVSVGIQGRVGECVCVCVCVDWVGGWVGGWVCENERAGLGWLDVRACVCAFVIVCVYVYVCVCVCVCGLSRYLDPTLYIYL